MFPAAPALSLLCARAWSDVRHNQWAQRNAASRIGLHLVGPFLVVVGAGCGYFLIARLSLPPSAAVVPIALGLAGTVITVMTNIRGGLPPRAPWIVLAALIITYGGLIVYVLPALEQRKVIPDVARWVASHAQPANRVASYRLNRWTPGYRFYVGRHATFLEDPAEADAILQGTATVLLRDAAQHLRRVRGAGDSAAGRLRTGRNAGDVRARALAHLLASRPLRGRHAGALESCCVQSFTIPSLMSRFRNRQRSRLVSGWPPRTT